MDQAWRMRRAGTAATWVRRDTKLSLRRSRGAGVPRPLLQPRRGPPVPGGIFGACARRRTIGQRHPGYRGTGGSDRARTRGALNSRPSRGEYP
jgi:hypothetical protein